MARALEHQTTSVEFPDQPTSGSDRTSGRVRSRSYQHGGIDAHVMGRTAQPNHGAGMDVNSSTSERPLTTLSDRVWLSRTWRAVGLAEGRLELSGNRLVFTVTRCSSRRTMRWLEQISGQAGLSDRVDESHPTTVLDVTSDAVTGVVLSRWNASATMIVTIAHRRWWFWFYKPPVTADLGDSLSALFDIRAGRKRAKRWKAVLGG